MWSYQPDGELSSFRKDLKILVIEDDKEDFEMILEMIRQIPGSPEWKIDWCYQFKSAVEQICKKAYDIYLLDFYLGDQTGLNLLKEVREEGCDRPIIMLTGKSSLENDWASMQNGAVDYLVKRELNSEKLERAIRYTIERIKTLSSLRFNEKKYRNIFEQSRDAVFLADDRLNFLSVNKAMQELLGYSQEELTKLSVTDLLDNDSIAEEIMTEFKSNAEIHDRELVILTSSGQEIICLFSANLMEGLNEKLTVQGIFHNITVLKKAEKYTIAIEKLSSNRRLAQYLAHEIRNPLQNIKLSIDQLKKATLDDHEQYHDIINRNAQRINQIVSKLLLFSESMEIHPTFCKISDIIDESLLFANDRIILRNVQATVHYPQQPVYIKAEKDKLVIAFLNIITNALEAIHHKNGQLSINVKKEGDKCLVKITDNGVGMDDATQARLFEPYFTTKSSGMGLGLTSALSILEGHLAKVEVISLANVGTTFSISFSTCKEGELQTH